MVRRPDILMFCLLFASAHGICGQNSGIDANSSADATQEENRQSQQIPDGLVFFQTLQRLGLAGSPADESSVELVKSKMGLDENEARDFIYLMTSTRRFVEAETVGVEERVGCVSGVPRAGGNEVYPILDAIYDEMINIAAAHLQLLKKNVGPENATKLQQWLDRQKPGNSYSKIDYKEHFERRGVSPDEILARICGTDAQPR